MYRTKCSCINLELRWADAHKFDLSALKNLMACKERVSARPKVQAALAKEGLPKAA